MELLDRYLHALKTYLPKSAQHDIIEELSDSIRSDVEEQEAALGRNLNRSEQEAVLKRYGHPMLAAARYLPQQYLIGPSLYPYYWFAIKVMVAILVLGYIALAVVRGFMSADPGEVAGGLVGGLFNTVVFGIGMATVGFMLLERSQVKLRFLENWSPSRLPAVTGPDAPRVPLSESIAGLVVLTILLLGWLSAAPIDQIQYQSDGVTVRLAPVWSWFYAPIVFLLLAGIAQNGVNLIRPHWTRFRAVTQIAIDLSLLVIVYLLLRHPELVNIIDAAGDPATYADKALKLSKVLGVGLAVVAAVFAVDLVLNLRRLLATGARAISAR